jgi:hypothetical protein
MYMITVVWIKDEFIIGQRHCTTYRNCLQSTGIIAQCGVKFEVNGIRMNPKAQAWEKQRSGISAECQQLRYLRCRNCSEGRRIEFPTRCLVVSLSQLLGNYDMARQDHLLPNFSYLPLILIMIREICCSIGWIIKWRLILRQCFLTLTYAWIGKITCAAF